MYVHMDNIHIIYIHINYIYIYIHIDYLCIYRLFIHWIICFNTSPSHCFWRKSAGASACMAAAGYWAATSSDRSTPVSSSWTVPRMVDSKVPRVPRRGQGQVINGISRVNPLVTGVITHLLSGMSHQVQLMDVVDYGLLMFMDVYTVDGMCNLGDGLLYLGKL